ncbi:MAG: DUF438 domain-containing protein [Pelolinea sp.]|nr:DUF438 domain-containing protein [Pelolinea sp.]
MSEYINNASQRKDKIKNALKRIHGGESYESVKQEFADVLSTATPQEISDIEQTLIAEGLPVEDIQYLCDVHVAMFRESLDQQTSPEMMPGHPVYTFRAENELVALVLNETKQTLRKLADDKSQGIVEKLKGNLVKLKEFDAHYLRKENLLFSYLEKVDFSGPSSVMWGIHDDIRKGWKAMLAEVGSGSVRSKESVEKLNHLFAEGENAMREMIYKEERILFPTALERLAEEDWIAMHAQEEKFGFSYVTRGNDWPKKETESIYTSDLLKEKKEERINTMTQFPLTTGDLSISQINMLLTHLPVDITYVDENDTVLYFSETPERIFKRTAAIIGRKVQNCHPPQSMDKVQKIVDDFRAGTRDTAEFWIQMNDMFIHIRYFALHDANGAYKGTLEVSQDLTHLRGLEGEKRLLDD